MNAGRPYPEDMDDQIEAELTRRLLSPARPLVLYVLGTGMCIGAMWWLTGAPIYLWLLGAAAAASLWRLSVIVAFGRRNTRTLDRSEAGRWEALHAVGAIGGSLVVSAFTLACLHAGDLSGLILALCFATGQAASVAIRNPRPWLARSQVTLTLLPIAIACILADDVKLRCLGALLAFCLASFFETLTGNVQSLRELLIARRDAAYAASRDALTGLVNRRHFDEALSEALNDERPCALILIDLDGFKPVNDLHGHAAGDEVLQQTARRLEALVDPADLVARIGGDEFAVLLLGERQAGAVKLLADRICLDLSSPVHLDHAAVRVGASAGAVIHAGTEHRAPGEIKRMADEALYASKRNGKGLASLAPPKLSLAV